MVLTPYVTDSSGVFSKSRARKSLYCPSSRSLECLQLVVDTWKNIRGANLGFQHIVTHSGP